MANRIGRAIVLWCVAATIAATTIGYFVVAARIERQAVETLSNYIEQRGRTESLLFETAEANLALFGARFREAYRNRQAFRDERFGDYFFADEDGAVRMRQEHFSGVPDEHGNVQKGLSGFIGRKRGALTPEFQRRLIIGYHLLGQFGPAWASQFANLHVSYPENALLMHWPQEAWGLQADPDLDMTAGAVIKATLQPHNPRRTPVWSGLYYDLTAGKWAVTYQLPVDEGGRHLVNPSHDIFLDGLIERLGQGVPAGARNLILAPNGDLVAQPGRMNDILQHKGVLNVRDLDDPQLTAIYDMLARAGDLSGGKVIKSDTLDAYVAATRIAGPGWWYVTVYPYPIIAADARSTAGVVLVVTLLLSAVIMAVVLLVLRLRVSRPMRRMRRAAEAVAGGEYRRVADNEMMLPDGDDEVGVLARSFRDMAARVDDHSRRLEATVAARTRELERAKGELETLLNEREALHARYQQAVGFIAMVEGPQHLFTFANLAFQTFVGRRDMIGRPVADVLPELAGSRLRDALDQVYASGEPLVSAALPLRVEAPDGSVTKVYVDAVSQPIHNPAGDVVGVFFEGHDVTEQRRAQEKIVTLQAQLIHLSRVSAMGTMGTTLAHELNQPLAAIANYSAALRKAIGRTQVDDRIREMVDAIVRTSLRAGEVIRSLRRLTGREAGRINTTDLATLVSESCSLALLDAPAGASIDAGALVDVTIDADPVQIQQVLLNLLRNAFEASEADSHAVRIVSKLDGGAVIVCVEDQGPGISSEAFPQLFDSFYSTKPSGTGIGLSISRTIIEAHDGTLWAENREGGGASFCFRLPVTVPSARRGMSPPPAKAIDEG